MICPFNLYWMLINSNVTVNQALIWLSCIKNIYFNRQQVNA